MSQQNFEKWSEVAKKLQEPFQAMTELNIRTMQGLSYIKPEELSQIKSPEVFLEKQVKLAVENGHKVLDYMQESFKIVEKAMLGLIQETKKATEGKK
jgi:hypothetical protein